jgi:uncharacterized protein (TIGR03089 family)
MSSAATDIRTALLSRPEPGQPFVTHLGEAGRVELSAASASNAAAKIANALVNEFDLEPGATVGLHLPWHWQRVTWLLGIWSAGCTAVPGGGEECDLLVAGPHEASGLPGSVQVVSIHPFGMPLDAATAAQLPPGVDDVTLAVRTQPDQQIFVADHSTAIALDGRTQERLLEGARTYAADLPGIHRLGITQGEHQWWLPALWPLVTPGSVVIADSSQRAALDGEGVDLRV